MFLIKNLILQIQEKEKNKIMQNYLLLLVIV